MILYYFRLGERVSERLKHRPMQSFHSTTTSHAKLKKVRRHATISVVLDESLRSRAATAVANISPAALWHSLQSNDALAFTYSDALTALTKEGRGAAISALLSGSMQGDCSG